MRKLLLVFVVGALGCGSDTQNYAGTYTGIATLTSNTCGAGIPSSNALSLTVVNTDNSYSVNMDNQSWAASENGSVLGWVVSGSTYTNVCTGVITLSFHVDFATKTGTSQGQFVCSNNDPNGMCDVGYTITLD